MSSRDDLTFGTVTLMSLRLELNQVQFQFR